MPAEFLQEVLEWNEAIDDARSHEPGSPQRLALEELAARLAAERDVLLARVAALLARESAPAALTEARKHLNAIRYLDRARREIAELGLTGAPTR